MTPNPPIGAVHVGGSYTNGDLEFYSIAEKGITDIQWTETEGPHCMLRTIRIYKKGQLHSEHLFHNCIGVYYLMKKTEDEDG